MSDFLQKYNDKIIEYKASYTISKDDFSEFSLIYFQNLEKFINDQSAILSLLNIINMDGMPLLSVFALNNQKKFLEFSIRIFQNVEQYFLLSLGLVSSFNSNNRSVLYWILLFNRNFFELLFTEIKKSSPKVNYADTFEFLNDFKISLGRYIEEVKYAAANNQIYSLNNFLFASTKFSRKFICILAFERPEEYINLLLLLKNNKYYLEKILKTRNDVIPLNSLKIKNSFDFFYDFFEESDKYNSNEAQDAILLFYILLKHPQCVTSLFKKIDENYELLEIIFEQQNDLQYTFPLILSANNNKEYVDFFIELLKHKDKQYNRLKQLLLNTNDDNNTTAIFRFAFNNIDKYMELINFLIENKSNNLDTIKVLLFARDLDGHTIIHHLITKKPNFYVNLLKKFNKDEDVLNNLISIAQNGQKALKYFIDHKKSNLDIIMTELELNLLENNKLISNTILDLGNPYVKNNPSKP